MRLPGTDLADGITTVDLGRPDVARLAEQYEAYARVLRELDIDVIELPPLQGFPDAYFVEDTAILIDEVAIIARPGVSARLGEQNAIEQTISAYRDMVRIDPPGTLDGGDILQVGSTFFIGHSDRTNATGCAQLGAILDRFGYSWSVINVTIGPHLKSSVSYIGDNTLLLTGDLAVHAAFDGYEKIMVDQEEQYASNSLLINGHILTPVGFPRTRRKLDALGCTVRALNMSEFQKMDGGLSCLSLRFRKTS